MTQHKYYLIFNSLLTVSILLFAILYFIIFSGKACADDASCTPTPTGSPTPIESTITPSCTPTLMPTIEVTPTNTDTTRIGTPLATSNDHAASVNTMVAPEGAPKTGRGN